MNATFKKEIVHYFIKQSSGLKKLQQTSLTFF